MKILVVSSDAGGAQLVSSWVRANPHDNYKFVLEEPAISIFEEKLDGIKKHLVGELSQLIEEADLILTGSSGSSDLEKNAIQQAILSNTKTVTFLDYWFGFRERFILDGKFTPPDEIWVGDQYALRLAKQELPESTIVLKPNPYLVDLIKEKEQLEEHACRNYGEPRFLYLCQPYYEDARLSGDETKIITDRMGLELFFTILASNTSVKSEIRLRHHPTQIHSTYLDIIHAFSNRLTINVSRTNSLATDLVWANIVVGMQAQALAMAIAFGLEVFHCIPDGGSACVLPHKELKDFNSYGKKNLLHEK